jgi:hypothetical protein
MQDNESYLRNLFKEADMDYSGFLTIDELYGVMLKMKIDMEYQDLVQLIMQYDQDGNGEIDIDEFVELMTGGGEDMNFED